MVKIKKRLKYDIFQYISSIYLIAYFRACMHLRGSESALVPSLLVVSVSELKLCVTSSVYQAMNIAVIGVVLCWSSPGTRGRHKPAVFGLSVPF